MARVTIDIWPRALSRDAHIHVWHEGDHPREEGGEFKGGGSGPEARLMDFEQYAAQHGASKLDYGEAGLHQKGINVAHSTHQRGVKAEGARNAALASKRDELQKKYEAEITAGTVRAPSGQEKMELTAQGHPDNAATQAARRVLAKRAARIAAQQVGGQ